MKPRSLRRPRRPVLVALACLAGVPAAFAQFDILENQPDLAPAVELMSPEELLPDTVEPGLSRRAVPTLEPEREPAGMLPLYRLNRMDSIRLIGLRGAQAIPDPASFRPVIVNEQPLGLHPRVYRDGLLEVYPWVGLSQSFDSNVNLTAENPISDFYLTPRAGVEFQLGTPDSVYNEFYETIFALRGSYEGWADLYYENPDLSAYNQVLDISARIGRSAAIWRPYFSFSDQTGSNLLLAELVNRTKRIRLQGGVIGEYQFTGQWGSNQIFAFNSLDHPNPSYINYALGRTRQELTWRVTREMRATAWGEYRYTEPDRGFAGSEYMAGVGFYGKPDPRIYTELRIGWDVVDMEGAVPGRRNMSGVRFNGWTTFDWGPRFRLTLRYDRDYVFNEVDENDNYVSTLLQTRGEFFLGGNWYVIPYLGCALQEFETSRRLTLQWRPELEVAYAFPSQTYPGDTKLFAKVAYMTSYGIRGESDRIEDWRVSVGVNWKF